MMDVYHCTPLEFKRQPAFDIDLHISFIKMRENQRKLEENRQLMDNDREKRMNKKI